MTLPIVGDAHDFVYGGEILFVSSSNVAAVQYHHKTRKMMVEYLSGGSYLYDEVSDGEALSFFRASSPGKWIWDNLRIRGTKRGHRKTWRRLTSR